MNFKTEKNEKNIGWMKPKKYLKYTKWESFKIDEIRIDLVRPSSRNDE